MKIEYGRKKNTLYIFDDFDTLKVVVACSDPNDYLVYQWHREDCEAESPNEKDEPQPPVTH